MAKWADNKNLNCIQLLGGPGIGKSTTAADLYSAMKKRGYRVELIHEIAKDLVWDQRPNMFYEQDWILAMQNQLQRRLVGRDIDYCVLDTSVLLGLFYAADDYPSEFRMWCRTVFDSYTNINVMLKRNPAIKYVQEGRNEDEKQAIEVDKKVQAYFDNNQIPHLQVVNGLTDSLQTILEYCTK